MPDQIRTTGSLNKSSRTLETLMLAIMNKMTFDLKDLNQRKDC